MRVNVVTESTGWILHRCAQELADRIPGVTVNGNRRTTDVNYYMPAYAFTKPTDRDPAIGLWTHPSPARLDAFTPRYRAHVAMNQRVAAELRARGAAPVVIRPGASVPARPLMFGVCGRIYPSGRKGESLVVQMIAAGYSVLGWGRGWPCPILSDDLSHLDRFYTSIDYLVVPSLEEGGPMPVVDALAHGVPVIAPEGVGWCDEFPAVRYRRGDWASLHAVLRGLTEVPTWEQWARGHAELFARLEAA